MNTLFNKNFIKNNKMCDKLLPIYRITKNTFEILKEIKENGYSVVDPPILSWSNYGTPGLEETFNILLNIDGIQKNIDFCLAAQNKILRFLEKYCLNKVEASCLMFCRKNNKLYDDITLNDVPIDIVKIIVNKLFE